MALDATNVSGTLVGNEVHGRATIKIPGGTQSLNLALQTFAGDYYNPISGTAELYDTRFHPFSGA